MSRSSASTGARLREKKTIAQAQEKLLKTVGAVGNWKYSGVRRVLMYLFHDIRKVNVRRTRL